MRDKLERNSIQFFRNYVCLYTKTYNPKGNWEMAFLSPDQNHVLLVSTSDEEYFISNQ